jgi:hypothetical protein
MQDRIVSKLPPTGEEENAGGAANSPMMRNAARRKKRKGCILIDRMGYPSFWLGLFVLNGY